MVHISPFIEYWDPITWNEKNEKYWGDFIRKRYVPLFEKYKVDLVIGGHQHNYQRGIKNNITYAIIGTGGGILDTEKVENYNFYNVTIIKHMFIKMELYKDKIEWQAINELNQTMDKFLITK